MRILKIILISVSCLIILYLLGIFIYGLFFGSKIDWTQESRRKEWDTYINQDFDYSLEYPPPISIKQEVVLFSILSLLILKYFNSVIKWFFVLLSAGVLLG